MLYICTYLFASFFRDADATYGLAPLSMAAVEQVTTKDLLFPFRDSFFSKVDIDSLVEALGQNQLLKKKEKKYLQRADEAAKKSFVYGKFYSADPTATSLSVDVLVKLFRDSENKKNQDFFKALESILAQKSATIGGYMLCMLYTYRVWLYTLHLRMPVAVLQLTLWNTGVCTS